MVPPELRQKDRVSVKEVPLDLLVQRAIGGDLPAAEEILRRFERMVLKTAYGQVGNWTDAEDIAQDALVHAFASLKRFRDDRGSFGTWLRVITLNTARDWLRRRERTGKRHAEAARRTQEAGVAISSAAEDAEAREFRLRVFTWLEDLTEPERQAFVLKDLSGVSGREAAATLGKRFSTFRVHLANARAKLRRKLLEKWPWLAERFLERGKRRTKR